MCEAVRGRPGLRERELARRDDVASGFAQAVLTGAGGCVDEVDDRSFADSDERDRAHLHATLGCVAYNVCDLQLRLPDPGIVDSNEATVVAGRGLVDAGSGAHEDPADEEWHARETVCFEALLEAKLDTCVGVACLDGALELNCLECRDEVTDLPVRERGGVYFRNGHATQRAVEPHRRTPVVLGRFQERPRSERSRVARKRGSQTTERCYMFSRKKFSSVGANLPRILLLTGCVLLGGWWVHHQRAAQSVSHGSSSQSAEEVMATVVRDVTAWIGASGTAVGAPHGSASLAAGTHMWGASQSITVSGETVCVVAGSLDGNPARVSVSETSEPCTTAGITQLQAYICATEGLAPCPEAKTQP